MKIKIQAHEFEPLTARSCGMYAVMQSIAYGEYVQYLIATGQQVSVKQISDTVDGCIVGNQKFVGMMELCWEVWQKGSPIDTRFSDFWATFALKYQPETHHLHIERTPL